MVSRIQLRLFNTDLDCFEEFIVSRNLDVLEHFIQGMNINKDNRYSGGIGPPIKIAISHSNLNAVKLFIKHGCKLQVRNQFNRIHKIQASPCRLRSHSKTI